MYMGQKLAIDIGSSSIKILLGNNKRIIHAVSIGTPENSFEDNIMVDVEKYMKLLTHIYLKISLKPKASASASHGQDIIIRHIEIPIMDRKKLREAVEWETNQFLPEGGTNYFIDYEIIDKVNTNEKKVYKLLVAAVLKEKVEQYAMLADKLGYSLSVIDLAANCLARVFYNRGVLKKGIKSIGIIDFGSKSSSIVIIDNGRLFMEREIPFGIDNIIREISRRLQINMDEASRYFIEKFDFNKMDIESELDRRIQELFRNVISTFQRVIEFYTSGKVEKNLDEIFVVGRGSVIKGIQNYLGGYLSSPVYSAENLRELGIGLNYPKDIMLNLYINSIGLLLRRNKAKQELNLLPYHIREKGYRRLKIKNYIIYGLIGLSTLFLLIYLPLSALIRVRNEEASWRERAEKENNALIKAENEKIKREMDIYKQYIGNVEQLIKKRTYISNRIHGLEKHIPGDVVFDSLSYGENSLSINGTAASLDSISNLASNIQAEGNYQRVRVSSILTEGVDAAQNRIIYRFTINAVEQEEKQ